MIIAYSFTQPAVPDFFGHLEALETSCKNNIDIFSPLKLML